MTFGEYLITVLDQFGGPTGGQENQLAGFGLSALFFATLFLIAWKRNRREHRPRVRHDRVARQPLVARAKAGKIKRVHPAALRRDRDFLGGFPRGFPGELLGIYRGFAGDFPLQGEVW